MLDLSFIKAESLSNASVLGKGGFGTVYRLRAPNGDDVAVKVFENKGCSDDEWRDRRNTGIRESEVSNAVNDENIIRVIGVTSFESSVFAIAYEQVAKTSLAQIIESKGSPSSEECMSITMCVARGIAAIHAAGIAHGDIKTMNILIMAPGVALIGDLGTAEFLPSSGAMCIEHEESEYPYWPPEYRKSGLLTIAADVYCFGIVLLELLIGKTMYSDVKLFDRRIKSLTDGETCDFRGSRLECFVDLAAKCVQKRRHDRPTAAECLEMLSQSTRVHTPPRKIRRVSVGTPDTNAKRVKIG